MKTVNVNAIIETKEEALKRMVDGEVFYYNGRIIFFDLNKILEGESPFRVVLNDSSEPLKHFIKHYHNFEIKTPWYQNITKPVPCWVDDTDSTKKDCIDLISGKEEGSFISISGVPWEYATPLTKKDIFDEY